MNKITRFLMNVSEEAKDQMLRSFLACKGREELENEQIFALSAVREFAYLYPEDAWKYPGTSGRGKYWLIKVI